MCDSKVHHYQMLLESDIRQLLRCIGTVEPKRQERIQQLSIAQLEDLAEALLDFSCANDLADWLQAAQQI